MWLQRTASSSWAEQSGSPSYLSDKRLVKSKREGRKRGGVGGGGVIFKCWLIEELQGIYFLLFPCKVITPHWRFFCAAQGVCESLCVSVLVFHLPPSYSTLREEAMASGEPGSPPLRRTPIVAAAYELSLVTLNYGSPLLILGLIFPAEERKRSGGGIWWRPKRLSDSWRFILQPKEGEASFIRFKNSKSICFSPTLMFDNFARSF